MSGWSVPERRIYKDILDCLSKGLGIRIGEFTEHVPECADILAGFLQNAPNRSGRLVRQGVPLLEKIEKHFASSIELLPGVDMCGAREEIQAGVSQQPGGPVAEIFECISVEDDPEVIFERFASEGWTDGLPIVPPTEIAVPRV